MNVVETLRQNLESSILAKRQMIESGGEMDRFAQAVDLIVRSYKAGGRLYAAGNGGSAADAQHLVAELVVRLGRSRAPLAAEALTVDSSVLTAIGNDFSFEEIFSRQVEGKMRKGDVFLAISTSGKSPNILAALRKCRELGLPSILLSGREGGEAKALADITLLAPGETTSAIQEVHLVLYHTLCQCVEAALFPPL